MDDSPLPVVFPTTLVHMSGSIHVNPSLFSLLSAWRVGLPASSATLTSNAVFLILSYFFHFIVFFIILFLFLIALLRESIPLKPHPIG